MPNGDELIGSVIDGKYRIQHLLGRGGMGAVYAATHLQLDRKVAVKILRPDLVTENSAVARFAREARATARIEHPNAVNVYDFGSLEGGGAYLVMELVEGSPLQHLTRANDPLPLANALDLIRQIAAALSAAHASGIIHRDVKPGNVLVRVDGAGRPSIKVVDFGLAKLLTSDSTTQLTGPFEVLGTPKYMAPEQFGGSDVDERVDVYALGILSYELIAGQAPFDGTFSEIVGKHLHMPPPPFASLGLRAPEAVEAAIRHALEKDPAERTPSVGEFVRELEEACGPEVAAATPLPLRAPPPPPPPVNVPRRATVEPPPQLPAAAPGSPADYETRYMTGSREESTRPREPELPTVFVPNRPAAPTGTMQGRSTTLLEPGAGAAARTATTTAWLRPAALIFAGLLVAGGAAFWATRGDEAAAPPASAPVPARPRPTVPAAEPPAPQRVEEPVERSERSPAPERRRSARPQADPVAIPRRALRPFMDLRDRFVKRNKGRGKKHGN